MHSVVATWSSFMDSVIIPPVKILSPPIPSPITIRISSFPNPKPLFLIIQVKSSDPPPPMAEEHRCQAPEGHRLCANNCGFFGSPATMDLCSKCYRDIRLKEQEQAKTKSTIETALSSASAVAAESLPPPPAVESLPQPPALTLPPLLPDASGSSSSSSAAQPNRCGACRKRVGLTGFKCRCGTTFCGAHRYPEKHGCGFDFKAVGREEIARANPVIKADKLKRI